MCIICDDNYRKPISILECFQFVILLKISVFSSEKLYVTRHSETRRKVSVICYWSCAFTFIVGAVVVAILIGSKSWLSLV